MTPVGMLRPVLVCLSGLALSSCGMAGGEKLSFEGMARRVADIPLNGSADAPVRTAEDQGMRPAFPASAGNRLKVEVMDPHDLWDARDGMRSAIRQVGSRTVDVAAPVVAEAAVQQVSARDTGDAPMRTAIAPSPPRGRTTIQLGAYSSPEAARAAWAEVSGGAARNALKGLSPVFEAVQVNGRPFTRLRVAAPAAAAAAICRAAEVSDPWCARRA